WGALNVLDTQVLTQVGSVLGIAVLMGLVAVASMLLAYSTSATSNLLSLRRESARAQTSPLWVRLGLDGIVACMGLVCYGCFLYVLNSSALTQETRALLLAPLLLLSTFLLLLAGCLGAVRLFPRLLAWAAHLATHSRSAGAMLAFAQMARAPRQSQRQVLLLALAIAFTLFTQVFLASQWQRLPAVAAYQAGADFSGERVMLPADLTPSLQSQTLPYRHLPGVLSATLGYNDLEVGAGSTAVEVQAVDTQSYTASVVWTPQDVEANLTTLTQQLIADRTQARTQHVLPAIVDAATWQALHLSLRTPFTLSLPDGTSLTYVPIAQVQYSPTLTPGQGASNGMLVDYQSYVSVYSTVTHNPPPLPSWVWLRTTNDPVSLSAIRAALNSGPLHLSPLYERRQLLVQLQQDPLLLALVGILVLGATVPLIFALGGSIVAFWLSARARLTNVAVLRALGSTPRQVARMLLWEQGLIYAAALLLGLLFGGLLTFFTLPTLIFSSLPPAGISSTGSTSLLYALQNAPPVRISIPSSLYFSTLGLLALVVVTFALMTSVVLRPALAQRLRLNED
ncbi:MAG: FtsX-like permease family protein, partial [Chloroflexota bacterium]|nr:FtsX-like permease family protein [Chloroflexota bacterium]